MPRLTVLIPCRNERMNIRPCVESVRGVADEILVADSGSEDETREIVRQMGGCRLIEREFVNYADFKNWAIPQASHPWVFILDADERLTEELAGEVLRAVKDPADHLDGYAVRRRLFFMGHEVRYGGWNTGTVVRLFRRDRCRYSTCRVHEAIKIDKGKVDLLKSPLLHYTCWSYDQLLEKNIPYTRWKSLDMWEQGRRTGLYGLLVRPILRFLYLGLIRRGFLDGLLGIQLCMFQAFFVSFIKQARLWEMEHGLPQPDPKVARNLILFPCSEESDLSSSSSWVVARRAS